MIVRAMAVNASENLLKAVLYCNEIFHVLSQKGHLRSDLQKRFDGMIEALTKMPDHTGKGTLYATISKMTDDEAQKWFEEIVSLFNEVEALYHATNEIAL